MVFIRFVFFLFCFVSIFFRKDLRFIFILAGFEFRVEMEVLFTVGVGILFKFSKFSDIL